MELKAQRQPCWMHRSRSPAARHMRPILGNALMRKSGGSWGSSPATLEIRIRTPAQQGGASASA